MTKKNHRQKIDTVLKYQTRFPLSQEFFKTLLSEPESCMGRFLLLYEFVLFYDRCFISESMSFLKKLLTETELEATSFREFEQVFQERTLLDRDPVPKISSKDPTLIGLSIEDFSIISIFTSEIFAILNSSTISGFSQRFLREKPPILQNADNSFFDAYRSRGYAALTEKIHCFDNDYNLCLKEIIKIWYSRRNLLDTFFMLKNFPVARFYTLVSLLYLDQNLMVFLAILKSFSFGSPELRERVNGLADLGLDQTAHFHHLAGEGGQFVVELGG